MKSSTNKTSQGGGGTFGVLTRLTVRTLPATPIAVYKLDFQTAVNSTVYWGVISYLLSQLPALSTANVSAFLYLYPSITPSEGSDPIASFEGFFALPDPSDPNALEDLWTPIHSHINATWANKTTTKATSTVFPNLYSLFLQYADDSTAGVDKVVGSWLLPPEILTEDAMMPSLVEFLGEAGGRLYMVSGRGVWDAQPRGGSDAVNPAWRKALIHAGTFELGRAVSI